MPKFKVTRGLKKGDRVIDSSGKTGIIKREATGFHRKMFVVHRDDGCGWEDRWDGGIGWNIPASELKLDFGYFEYDMDAG